MRLGRRFARRIDDSNLERQTATGQDEPTATTKPGFAFSQIAEKKKTNANMGSSRLLGVKPDGQG
jgi:hypothetical protein